MECKTIIMEKDALGDENKKTICIICGKAKETYLSDNNINGIIVNGEYICRNCEEDIIETKVEENKYDDLVGKIKVVIYK